MIVRHFHSRYFHSILRLFAIVFIFLLRSIPCVCEEVIDNDWGYCLDLPAGYKIADQDEDGLSVMFTHGKIPVTVVSKIYAGEESAENALRLAMRRLPNCYFDINTVPYTKAAKDGSQGNHLTDKSTDAALACFTMTLDGEKGGHNLQEGWAVAAPLLKGSVVVIAYTQSADGREGKSTLDSKADVRHQVIVSILNSLAASIRSKREAGIMTRFAYPAQGQKAITLNIGGHIINTSIDASSIEAANFTVGVEYAVLSLYADGTLETASPSKGPPLYMEAWKRYYRAIFRDALGALKGAASDVYRALRDDAIRSGNEGYYLSSVLLSWVQSMPYSRGENAADFTSLPAALSGAGCDCDTRSLLLCTLLDIMGIRCAIFVSRVYSHAIFGADIKEAKKSENARLKIKDTSYLLGETTAKNVNMGMISAEHQDAKKWMGVELD